MTKENKAVRFYYLDVDITDKNVDLSSVEKIEEKIRVLYDEQSVEVTE